MMIYRITTINMRTSILNKGILICHFLILIYTCCLANEDLYRQARALQRERQFDQAVHIYKEYLSRPLDSSIPSKEVTPIYTDALVQLMNTFQSMGDPNGCITALEAVYEISPALQKQYQRDYYSVLGYALSRTENMKDAEETMMKALARQLHNPTPERYFRDYAYAAAVFYNNPKYQKEVVNWCHEALHQAQLSENTAGQQWVTAMLGSIYKQNGELNKALELFQQSKDEAQNRDDDLGVLNSLHKLTDLFLYWEIPEYANLYASEAIDIERTVSTQNPMISAQTYINKGRALHQLGSVDSIPFYADQARKLCESLPYNSGMVDVNLLNGIYLTEVGGDSISEGIEQLQTVTRMGTETSRARAYHRLAQTYLKQEQGYMAEKMLDSLYLLIQEGCSPVNIHIDYQPILNHYLKKRNFDKVDRYVKMMFQEDNEFNDKRVNFNLVDAIVDLQTGKKIQELRIDQLRQANERLLLLICIAISVITVSFVLMLLFNQRRQHRIQIRQADEKLAKLVEKLNESNVEKEKIGQEIKDFLKNKDKRQELETLTPFILKEEGESRFRQCFELLYPLFLHRLREKVPSVTRREELLSMLIALKQDNKTIADLMAIAPRSVLMLRHRFRQKIGLATEVSLENFIEDTLRPNNSISEGSGSNS